MHIDIALRFKPFSHLPGTTCLVPGSDWRVQIFPTLIHFFGPNSERHTEKFSVEGPIEDFTIEQDLEKKRLRVFGRAKQGFICYYIAATSEAIEMQIEKGEKKTISTTSFHPRISTERLSLGIHKLQDWEGICKRLDLREILPLWFQLGQMIPVQNRKANVGSLQLLEECRSLSLRRERLHLENRLQHLFMAGFGSLLNPRLNDSEYQGILSDHPEEDNAASLQLLSQGADLIRRLFFFEEGSSWHVLSCLLPRFDSGRLVSIKTEACDTIDLEWSKSAPRRMVIRPKADRSVTLHFPKEIQRYRLRQHLQDKGRSIQAGEAISLVAGKIVLIDRFEK